MSQIFVSPFVRATTKAGLIAPGAKLFFYSSGTTSLVNVYANDARTVALPNPVVADAFGMHPTIFLNPDIAYRVRLTNSAGVLLAADADPVYSVDKVGIVNAAIAGATAASAANSADAQAAASAAIIAAATSGVYPIAAASNVPRGAALNVTTAGSGGTNGTNYVATYTGGNYIGNPTILYDVVAGAVANVRLTDPGLYIGASPTAPTVVLGSGAGGAALTLTNVFRIGTGSGYWVQAAGGLTLDRYKNVAGVATADTAIESVPTEAALLAVIASFGDIPVPLNADALVGARESSVIPAANAATIDAEGHFTMTTAGASVPVNITGDYLGDTTSLVTASVQIVSGTPGTSFVTAIGRWADAAGTQIGADIALTKTATAVSLPAGSTQPAGAHKLTFGLIPAATTVCRRMTYQLGNPARPTTDPWFLSMLGAGMAQNSPTPISYLATDTGYNPITGRFTVPAASGGAFQLSVPSGVVDGDVLWVYFDSPLEPTAWLQYITANFGASGGNGGNNYVSQVLHVFGHRYAVALYIQSVGGVLFYGPRWTYNNTGAATYIENIKLYVGPNPPLVETATAISLKSTRDEIDTARIKPLITLADDSCGISSTPQFLPDPGKSLRKFLGVGTRFQNFSTPGNQLADSASTVGLLPIHVSVSGGVIPASTSPVSITAWDQNPITINSISNPEFDPYAYLCGVLGLVTAGSWSGAVPATLFFTPITAPDWPIDVPNGSKLVLRSSRKRKGGLTLFPISSVNGTGGGGNSGSPFASVTAFVDAVFAANDPNTIAGFVGLTASPYGTGQSQLTAFSAKSYYSRLFNPNIMSAATVAEAQTLFGWNWTGTENADWLAGNIGIPGSMRWPADGFHPVTDVSAYVLAKNLFTSAQVTSYLENWA
jgi:hypothetical protein